MTLRAAHTFALLGQQSRLTHGCFHRHGGVSPAPFASLNVSFGVGDAPAHVSQNRALVKEALGCPTLVSCRQVHGDRVAVVDEVDFDQELDGYDALITDRPGVALLIQQADCQAILLHDPHRRAIAAIHCGWRGSVANIIAATIARLTEIFHSRPGDLQAAISPALGPCCAEFIDYRTKLPADFHSFAGQASHVDFPAISAMQLQRAGVRPDHIEAAGICTRCNHDWFSYRRRRDTGRCCSAIGLLP